MKHFYFLSLIFLSGQLLLLGQVRAHGALERTDPPDGSHLTEPPTQIRVWFTEPLVPDTGQILLIQTDGTPIQPTRVYHSPTNPNLVTADLPANLPVGMMIVTALGVVVSDGHQPQGSFTFWLDPPNKNLATSGKPAYGLVLGFIGLLGVASLGGYWLFYRPEPLELQLPVDSISHFKLD